MSETPYIYTMHKLGKQYPPDRVVLKDMTLAFLHGAKIGVLGANGSGKSTLLRIMAGLDTRFVGDAQARRLGDASASSRRSPSSTRRRTSAATSRTACAPPASCSTASTRSRWSSAEPDAADRMDELLAEKGKLQDRDRRDRRAGASTATSTTRWTRCGCRRATPTSRRSRAASAAASRSAGCCWRHPTCCCSTSRRTTSTPSRSRGSSASWASTPARSSPSRTIATSSTTSPGWILELDRGRGIPFEGNYSSWLEQKQARLALEEKQESARQRDARSASSSGSA